MVETQPTGRPTVSVVIPVYKCDECLHALSARLITALERITDRYEIVYVDDRSPDNAWATIQSLQDSLPCVRGVRLSRNFGQQAAISAGLGVAKGDLAVVMDCDLQDPPELIPDLYARLEQGFDLVITKRAVRSHGALRASLARFYFHLLSIVTGRTIDGNYGAFSILRRNVVDAFLKFHEPGQHYIFALRWLGFRLGVLEYAQEERAAGRSAYTPQRLLDHAISGLLLQTNALLRWIVTVGLVIGVAGFILAVYFLIRNFFIVAVPGWTSLWVLGLLSTGAIMTSLGGVGLYIGNIFDQVKGRPLYVVDTVIERTAKW